jgi:hypothetical protein
MRRVGKTQVSLQVPGRLQLAVEGTASPRPCHLPCPQDSSHPDLVTVLIAMDLAMAPVTAVVVMVIAMGAIVMGVEVIVVLVTAVAEAMTGGAATRDIPRAVVVVVVEEEEEEVPRALPEVTRPKGVGAKGIMGAEAGGDPEMTMGLAGEEAEDTTRDCVGTSTEHRMCWLPLLLGCSWLQPLCHG